MDKVLYRMIWAENCSEPPHRGRRCGFLKNCWSDVLETPDNALGRTKARF